MPLSDLTGIRLYTWVDVEEALYQIIERETALSWLVNASAYWEGLTLTVKPGFTATALSWLADVFAPRYGAQRADGSIDPTIVLESTDSQPRLLPVFIEEDAEGALPVRFHPSFQRRSGMAKQTAIPFPEPIPGSPPVITFHSFKGGVGRTAHAIALAKAISNRNERVLLIDGDLEAPGISWLLHSRLTEPPISFADFLALVQGDLTPDYETAISLTYERLLNAEIDGIYVMPAFRTVESYISLEIRPEHVVQGAKDPYILTNVLTKLGHALGVRAVIIDLRAGFSELAAGILLDPRNYRVLVTTLGGQSIAGTEQVLRLLGRSEVAAKQLGRGADYPLPSVMFNMSPVSSSDEAGMLLSTCRKRILEAATDFVDEANDWQPTFFVSDFDSNLLGLPLQWEDVISLLDRSSIAKTAQEFLELLPEQITFSDQANTSDEDISAKRKRLERLTEKLIYAETSSEDDWLITSSLQKLASDNRRQVPSVVVVGAKGAGKTFTFLQLVRLKTWDTFVHKVEELTIRTATRGSNNLFTPTSKETAVTYQTHIPFEATIFPVLASIHLTDAKELVKLTQEAARSTLGFSVSMSSDEVRKIILDNLKDNLHEIEWREKWLNIIAWSLGFRVKDENAGVELAKHLRAEGQRVVCLFDGLEDLFPSFSTERSQQIALRALLQEVPDWLNQQPGKPLGIVAFVREDMISTTIKQNAGQFLARYSNYALKWSREEALRLVAWTAIEASVLGELSVATLQDMDELHIIESLYPLWGRKLGKENSREGRSAEWVISALSDYKGQIQARDLMRMLNQAAHKSISDHQWTDRILTPNSIRRALRNCSEKKIEEIKVENPSLKEIFNKMESHQGNRSIPFKQEELELTTEDIRILEYNGVLGRENDDYYMPEIFRYGLGFEVKSRPNILGMPYRLGRRK